MKETDYHLSIKLLVQPKNFHIEEKNTLTPSVPQKHLQALMFFVEIAEPLASTSKDFLVDV